MVDEDDTADQLSNEQMVYALRESEQRYRAIFENMKSGVALYQPIDDGRDFLFKDFNRAAEEISQVRKDEVIGKRLLEEFPNMDKFGLLACLQRVYQTGKAEHIPVSYYKDEQREGWRDNFVCKLPNGEMVAIYDDITDRKQVEEALGRSERKHRELTELLPQGVFELDNTGRIAFANRAFLQLHGYNSDEFPAILNPVQLIIPEDRERVADNIKKMLAGQELVVDQCTILKKDGTTVPIIIHAAPISENKEIIGVRGVIVDISPLKKAEKEREKLKSQLYESQKMEALGTLVGGIAHDFNNMLQIILGYSQLLLEDRKKDDPSYKDLRTIIETVKGGADLVNKLLAFGKQSPIFPIPLDLNHRVMDLTRLISRTLPQIVKIDFDLKHGTETIYADPNQVDQIVMNLAVNASEAMPKGGTLRIGTTTVSLDDEYCRSHNGVKPGPYVMLSVCDTGCGMDAKTLSRIFEPFFSTKQRGATRGTGLGLSVAQGIVEQQGGHITCESEPGKGSKFRVYFPAFDSGPASGEKISKSAKSTRPGTILVVEDIPQIADLSSRFLHNAGYPVITAATGQEAIAIYQAKKREISLVILDLIMPEMSGTECLMELVKIDPSVKVLIASGFSPCDELHREINPLVKGFVQKPFAMTQLLDEVRSVLRDK